jgi:flavin reductase (DIM6/NTAB) family NADH-FMN oxidoreductase RutF
MQITDAPNRIAVCINRANLSCETVKKTGIMNVCPLSEKTPFSFFENFGMKSGRDTDKFAGMEVKRTENSLIYEEKYSNAVMSLKVEKYVDLDTHGMFICSITEARVITKAETMTYTYYQENVKPKPETEGKSGYVCKVCGWVYEGDTLPDDIVCPLCKHGAADFEKIQ